MKIFIALFCLFLCLLFCLPANAAPTAVVVVVLPDATLRDWQNADAPILHRLMQTGSLGVMNTRTAHQAGHSEVETPQSELLTLGAGARAAGTAASLSFSPASAVVPNMSVPTAGISASALFQRRTGTVARPGQSVCLDWPAVAAANRNSGYDLGLGNLADTLAVHGIFVAAGGRLDADWLAVSSSGIVQHVSKLRAASGLCLIWGGGPDLHSADAILASAAAQVAALQGRLVVLSPLAGNAKSRQLAPVLVWGPGVPAGLLHSPSTRRLGLVTNTDFAPSVAACFGIKRTQFQTLPFGFAWLEVTAAGPTGVCARLNQEAVQQSHGMRLLPYTAAALGLWVLAVTFFASRLSLPRAVLLVPVFAVIAALFAVSALSFGLLLLGLTGVAAWIRREWLPAAASVLTVLALGADMITGNRLMHRGLLGYSALEGARYYGIGNEAMGLLLGAALFAASTWWQPKRVPQVVLAGVMGGIVLLLGSAGAKAGGVLVSLAVFGTFLYTASGRLWTARAIALLAAAAFVGMGVAALGDMVLHPGSHSHIGEAVSRISGGGIKEAWDIITRKLAVEGRLAYHSAWALLLWLGLCCTVWLWRSRPAADHRQTALRLAGLVGIAACLLLNDAGVVAAAIFGIFLWTAAVTQKALRF